MEYAAAPPDLVDVQVAAGAEDLQPACVIGVPKPYRPVARGGAGAVRREVAEGRVGEAEMHAHDRADRGTGSRRVGLGTDLPRQRPAVRVKQPRRKLTVTMDPMPAPASPEPDLNVPATRMTGK